MTSSNYIDLDISDYKKGNVQRGYIEGYYGGCNPETGDFYFLAAERTAGGEYNQAGGYARATYSNFDITLAGNSTATLNIKSGNDLVLSYTYDDTLIAELEANGILISDYIGAFVSYAAEAVHNGEKNFSEQEIELIESSVIAELKNDPSNPTVKKMWTGVGTSIYPTTSNDQTWIDERVLGYELSGQIVSHLNARMKDPYTNADAKSEFTQVINTLDDLYNAVIKKQITTEQYINTMREFSDVIFGDTIPEKLFQEKLEEIENHNGVASLPVAPDYNPKGPKSNVGLA